MNLGCLSGGLNYQNISANIDLMEGRTSEEKGMPPHTPPELFASV
jgi:hypothetical protein